MEPFKPHVPFIPSHPDALAVYCSDGRFTQAVEALLTKLGYPRLDTLTIPGGPGLMELTSASSNAVDVVRNAVSFLVTGHAIKHVVLIAHEGCGYYKSRFPYESPEAMVRRQYADMRGAHRWLLSDHGKLDVSKFFARRAGAGIEFEPTE